jgi:propanol-preferring alcohol dehydrogenase
VQILRATSSARVVAVDPRAEACALAESLGAHHAAVSVEEGMAHLAASSGLRGVDVVLDFVGSDGTMRLGADVLTPGGRLVVVGGARGSIAVGKGMTLPLGWQVSAPFWGRRDDLVAVVELAERGLLDPVIEVVPFDAVPEAYARLRDGAVAGRLVAVHDDALIPLGAHRPRRRRG